MKHILWITSVISLATLVAGCKPAEKATASSEAAARMDKAQAAAADAAEEMRDYAYEQRAEFVADMEVKLAAMNREVDELSAKIARSSDSVKAEAKPRLAALREQVAQLTRQVAAAKDATPTTWTGIKADAHKSYTAVKDGFNQARQWVSDKIAP